jgi:RimJ/RimL family protein N-acetyltransferase
MDVLDFDPAVPGGADAAVRLIETALAALLPHGTPRPQYTRFAPGDWRDHAEARRSVEDRMTVLERTGAKLFVERLRLQWRPGTPIADPTGRLAFRTVLDTELIDLMTRVMDGTLDAHGRDDLTRMTAAEAARKHYEEELALYGTPRDWWQIATTRAGDPVGFVIPAHNGYNPIIAYLGVLPEHRGHGYIDEILAAGTRLLAAQDVPRIRASTDVGNVPMARAFERAGYVNFERQLDMTWP